MTHIENLKILVEKANKAPEYFERRLSEKTREQAVEKYTQLTREIAELTEIIESIYGKDCIDWDKVELKDNQISMGV